MPNTSNPDHMSLLESIVRQRVKLTLWHKVSHKRTGIDYDDTIVMDVIALHYLVSLVASGKN